MNNLKKNSVLLLIVIMTLSLVMVPFTPTTQVNPQVATPQVSTPEQVMQDLDKYIKERSLTGPLDSVLSAYLETGTFPSSVPKNNAGAMGIIVTVESDTDMAGLQEIIDVNWKVDLGAMKLVSAFVGSTDKVLALADFDGVVAAYADSLKTEVTTGIEPRPIASADTPNDETPDAYVVDDWIGATTVNALGYKGEGMRVGVIDTGSDFSIPDLFDAVDMGADGMATSYDPTGYGFGCLLYRVNATAVNATTWLGLSGWNLLSYMKDGKYYVDWSSMNAGANYVNGGGPRVNNQGGLVNLDWWTYGYLAAWWGNEYPNQANLTDFYETVMRQDLELPNPNTTMSSPLSGGIHHYTIGYIMQQRNNPYMKIFAPAIVLNGTTVVVDWNTTRAHTDFWNLNINYGVWDFNDTAAWTYYENMGDWSFVDDLEAGKYYKKDGIREHSIMYNDWPDGRFGLGVLSHCWEMNIFGLGMINGIGLSGRAIGIMYDGNAHGTFVAGQIASRGLTDYPVGLNGTLHKLIGVAPEATVMGVMAIGISNEFNSMFYAAGFDFDGDYFSWNNESTHRMYITSNSWGWSGNQDNELWAIYSLIYATIATPGYFAVDYPGMVQCFSSGNSGPGYATIGAPGAAQLIHVGATTSYHTFENSYGPNQGFDQLASFSSRGPMILGYPKPDIVAPGNNVYGLFLHYDRVFLGINDDTAIYGGTSMACPLVAGSAALMIQAYNDTNAAMPRPDYIKTVLQSTAVDLGMDPLAQGNGRVDVAAAVDYITGVDGVRWYNTDSNANWGVEYGDAWAYQMNPYDGDAFINDTVPANYADMNLYFGTVAPGGTVSMTFNGAHEDGTPVALAEYTWAPTYYTFDQLIEFSYETSIYNESTSTGSPSIKAGYFEFNDYLTTEQQADFYNAKYVTIHISGAEAVFADDSMWSFVFDWSDTSPANGVPDFYNPVSGLGDELTRWQYGGGTAQNIKMDLCHPLGMGELFPNTGIVMVHDDNIWGWPYAGGNLLDVKIVLWTEVPDTQITLGTNPAGGIFANLTVAAGTDYGIHQGYIVVYEGPEFVDSIPYTFNVVAELATHDGSGVELANGAGDAWTPYDPARVNAGWDTYYESCDYGSYVVDVTDTAIRNIVVRVEWTNPSTDIDVALFDISGLSFGSTAGADKATETSSVAIVAITEPMRLIIYTIVNWLEGPLPEDYVVTIYGYDESLPTPQLHLYWSARDVPTRTEITSGGSAIGDHVLMNATWTYPAVGGIPEFVVTTLEMKVLYGVLFDSGDVPLVPNLGHNPFGGGAINPDAYAWVTVPVTLGDVARVVCSFTNGDDDIMAWYSTTAMADRTYANNIMGGQMATGANPEVGSFTVSETGTVEFGVLNFDNAVGTFRLTVDTRAGLEPARVDSDTFEIDTYYLLLNQTYSVLVDSDTGTNIHYMVEIPDIFIGNFFAPVVTVDVPDEISTNYFNITWSSVDRNADDENYYALFLSDDNGETYQLMQQNGTQTFYLWNASGWAIDSYIARVRAYSLDFATDALCGVDNPPTSYWPGDFADGVSAPFDAGDVEIIPPTTTTTTSTTTSITTTTPPVGIDPLLIGLVGGIGVGVVIILILFLIRKK